MSTNRVKWDDTNNRLTAYCDDDSGETEIGPIKWDDTNNRLELNCDSTDYTVKWNDTDNELEAQSVGSGCCELVNCGMDTAKDYIIDFSGITDCGDCNSAFLNNNNLLCEYLVPTRWQYFSTNFSANIYCNANGTITCSSGCPDVCSPPAGAFTAGSSPSGPPPVTVTNGRTDCFGWTCGAINGQAYIYEA